MKLEWLLNPITLNVWVNAYMQKWDWYMEENPLGLALLDIDYYDNGIARFPKF
jgi:hypothetical protein